MARTIVQAHHDGSELFVSNSAPRIGEKVTLKVRVPKGGNNAVEIWVRLFHDGEPRTFQLKKQKRTKFETWWSVSIEIVNSVTHYRFLLIGKSENRWLNGEGVFNHDVVDREDFQIIAVPELPRWVKSSVFYQIFPDRFASSGAEREVPKTFVKKKWSELPEGRSENTGVEFYGGDFDGVREHLDHLQELGASAIYFTPFFPGLSSHRYDATSFDAVDPLLGGDEEFLKFMEAAHKKGFKVVGDLTTNHCGAGHPWIKQALADVNAKEREFFYWDSSIKHGYAGWWGLASLPKLNYGSRALRALMYEDPASVVKKWLKPPFALDGWRIDVGNMTGRYFDQDVNKEIARGIRSAMDSTNPDAWLVAENADHSPEDLDGFGWHGTMNYNGFARPVVNWLYKPKKKLKNFAGLPGNNPTMGGVGLANILRSFAAGIPWRSLTSSMVLLDSHDTARFRTIVGNDISRHLVGATLLFTYPGVPSIFAGDEIGLEGAWGEDARRTINWESKKSWSLELFAGYKALVKLRKKSDALINGGIRWILVSEDALAYLRESKKESLLVYVSRSGGTHNINLKEFGLRVTETLYGPTVKGASIKFKSRGPVSGIWKLK